METATQEKPGVFVPKGTANYFSQYPELREIEEFANLTEPEMKFVFYHYSPDSPFANLKAADRFVRSSDMSFTNGSAKQAFAPSAIPETIERAGQRMAQVNLGLRTQADVVVKQMFRNLTAMMAVDEKTIASMPIDEKKKYVSMAKDATETLAEMISTMERGFGLRPVSGPHSKKKSEEEETTVTKKADKKNINLADRAIEQSR